MILYINSTVYFPPFRVCRAVSLRVRRVIYIYIYMFSQAHHCQCGIYSETFISHYTTNSSCSLIRASFVNLLSRGSNTNCLCFVLRSFLTRLPSTFQNYFTFTLPPGSSALLQTPECSEYHPSEQACGQRSFSYQAPVTWNQLPVSVRHSTSITSFVKTFLFLKTFSSVSLP